MKHRLGDIVRETGYSTATVSRALNGSSWVAERTRLKILEAARKTGYLRSERTVTLVVPNISINYYYKCMVDELEAMLRHSGPGSGDDRGTPPERRDFHRFGRRSGTLLGEEVRNSPGLHQYGAAPSGRDLFRSFQ